MAGKPMATASRALAMAVDVLSKNTLADIVVDRIRAEIGEHATDEQVAKTLERWAHPVATLRGEKTPGVTARLRYIASKDADYLARNGI